MDVYGSGSSAILIVLKLFLERAVENDIRCL